MSPCRGSKRHPLESTMSPNAARSISVLSPKSLNDCRAINVLNEKLCRRMTYLVQNQENAPPTPSPNKQPPKPSPVKMSPIRDTALFSPTRALPCSPARDDLRKSALSSSGRKKKSSSSMTSLVMPEQAAWARETASVDYDDLSEEVEIGCFSARVIQQFDLVDSLLDSGSIVLSSVVVNGQWAAGTAKVLKAAIVFGERESEPLTLVKETIEVAAALLMMFQHDESKAFWTLLYIVSSVFDLYWRKDGNGLEADQQAIGQLITEVSPELEEHLSTLGLTVGQLVVGHLRNGFAGSVGPRVLKQLWTLLFEHGRHALVAASVAVLVWSSPELQELTDQTAASDRFSDAVSVCLQPGELGEAVGIWMEALPRAEYQQIVQDFMSEASKQVEEVFGGCGHDGCSCDMFVAHAFQHHKCRECFHSQDCHKVEPPEDLN